MSCSSSSPPDEIFETVWETFDRRYALFEVKSVDWRALHDVYRPRVTPETTDEELFEVLTGMMSHLNDNHVMLTAGSLGRDFSAGYLGRYFEELGLAGAMAFLSNRPLPQRYFRGEPRTAGEGTFQYGWVDEGVGYMHFGGFTGEAESAEAVDEILVELSSARALIVDVRNNSGGDDRVGKAIADRFADRRRLYMVTRDRVGPGHGDFAEPYYWHVDPSEHTFTKPIVLLTSRLSISAAENFALAMRVLPHVTVVGDTTSGCFADMVWFDLPNGWRYSLSRNLFVDYTGRCWEGTGVPPDVLIRGEHVEGQSDRAFETALGLLQGDGPPPQDESASAAAVRHDLVSTLARGLESGGFDEARSEFETKKSNLPPESWYVHERDINALGYQMLTDGRLDDAVGVFKLQVELLPEKANAYDSLGEAYMKRGDTEEAIANYERSLELNPDNENAVEVLKKLRR
jgi:C-terminal processing protease CtpA/Prc